MSKVIRYRPVKNGKDKVWDILADNVQRYLDAKDQTGAKIAAKTGAPTQKTMWNIVNKRHKPTIATLEKIAKATGIEPYQWLCPWHDGIFLTIIQAYNEADVRGREYLVDHAGLILKKARGERPKAGAAEHR